MAKYDALERHLSVLVPDEWNASFAEIERILGFGLPASARKFPAWWANQDGSHSQAQAWRNAGWQTSELNLARGSVRFLRVRARGSRSYSSTADRGSIRQSLAEEARRFSGIEGEEELMREGYKALIEREAARKLAQLGGTMPRFEPPPRRRGE